PAQGREQRRRLDEALLADLVDRDAQERRMVAHPAPILPDDRLAVAGRDEQRLDVDLVARAHGRPRLLRSGRSVTTPARASRRARSSAVSAWTASHASAALAFRIASARALSTTSTELRSLPPTAPSA